jgi:hypothetical protein
VGPFVDGDDLPMQTYLVSARALLCSEEENGESKSDDLHIQILDIVSVRKVDEIKIIAQRLLLAEISKSGIVFKQIEFSDVTVREIATQNLKKAIPSSRQKNRVSSPDSVVAFIL